MDSKKFKNVDEELAYMNDLLDKDFNGVHYILKGGFYLRKKEIMIQKGIFGKRVSDRDLATSWSIPFGSLSVDLTLARHLIPEAKEAALKFDITKHVCRYLARLPEEMQRDLLNKYLKREIKEICPAEKSPKKKRGDVLKENRKKLKEGLLKPKDIKNGQIQDTRISVSSYSMEFMESWLVLNDPEEVVLMIKELIKKGKLMKCQY